MRRSTSNRLGLVIAIVAAAGSCASPRPEPARPEPALGPGLPADVAQSVLIAHNRLRSKAGRSPLALNPALGRAAAGHARDMADRRKMSHRGGDGSSPFDRIERQGYRFRSAAENVAYGYDDVDSVMDGWMHSPGHRRNILGDFREIGVGRAVATDGVISWCVTFGSQSGP